MLEECGYPYRVHRVDLFKNEQKYPEFLKFNAAGAIPVIVDADGPGGRPLTLAHSGAIALYPVYAVRKAQFDAAGGPTNLHRWGAALGARPGVAKGMKAAD